MKVRMCSVRANDGDIAVEVKILVAPRKGYPLEEDELDVFVKKAARVIATSLYGLPFSDFGPENVSIELSAKAE